MNTEEDLEARADLARHGFGAQFCEVAVDADTGEVRVPRMLGVFAVGRIINPKTARSQFIGGMTMGLGMAL
ncbi:MAG TPA: molybdopterin cofactor-binding domain-containing protein, partial [Solirubrobacteraceae bacterium]|nr:molybdopterin cofactor-binding domain-containing protein [Solirubrobacteraceae bacterium]